MKLFEVNYYQSLYNSVTYEIKDQSEKMTSFNHFVCQGTAQHKRTQKSSIMLVPSAGQAEVSETIQAAGHVKAN